MRPDLKESSPLSPRLSVSTNPVHEVSTSEAVSRSRDSGTTMEVGASGETGASDNLTGAGSGNGPPVGRRCEEPLDRDALYRTWVD